MSYTVRSTPVADRQIAGLRGARRKAYDLFEDSLARQGCAALGYRLTGDEPLPSLCVKHLRGNDRAVVTFSRHEAWVLLVGPHIEGDAADDVYAALSQGGGLCVVMRLIQCVPLVPLDKKLACLNEGWLQ